MSRSTHSVNAPAQSAASDVPLGPPPLMEGEDSRGYGELHERIRASLQPRDSLEEIWIRDIVDLVWDTFRLRRAKASLMTDEAQEIIERHMRESCRHAVQIARSWAARDEEAASQVERALGSGGCSMERVAARAMTRSLNIIERMDRMLTKVEIRRSAALRELERYRGPLGEKLRLVIAQEEAGPLHAAPPLAAAEPA
jgi:hypothetical protein